jgi:hypothetical protein
VPNGIAIRAQDGTIFITDDRTNSVLSSKADHDFKLYATIPVVAGQPNGLSQVSVAESGEVRLARFGFGTAGALLGVDNHGAVVTYSGPDPARRRLGLADIGGGRLLSTWFVKRASAPAQGGLSMLTIDSQAQTATERDLMSGLGKPVGVAVLGDTVYVSDQMNDNVVKARLSTLMSVAMPAQTGEAFAHVTGPDLLAVDTDGTLYTKCNSTSVCRIAADGTVTAIANDFQDARGVALDAAHRQLLVVDRAKAANGTSYLRTIPLR